MHFSLYLNIFTSYYIPEKSIKKRMENNENVNITDRVSDTLNLGRIQRIPQITAISS